MEPINYINVDLDCDDQLPSIEVIHDEALANSYSLDCKTTAAPSNPVNQSKLSVDLTGKLYVMPTNENTIPVYNAESGNNLNWDPNSVPVADRNVKGFNWHLWTTFSYVIEKQ